MSGGLLGRVVASLTSAGIRHAVIGAGALALHGVSRSTFDIDLFTTNAAALVASTWAGLKADPGVHVDIRRGDSADPLLGVVRCSMADERDVDVVVGRQAWQTDVVARAVPVDLSGVELSVVTPADLILLKLYAGGPQDLWDIEQLLATGARQQLAEEVDNRIDNLPRDARATWSRIRTPR
jgi:predicted nucleotidyltransferase